LGSWVTQENFMTPKQHNTNAAQGNHIYRVSKTRFKRCALSYDVCWGSIDDVVSSAVRLVGSPGMLEGTVDIDIEIASIIGNRYLYITDQKSDK
jgi:hypothetical protein